MSKGRCTTFGLIAACVYYAFSLFERAKAETETVLRNVLPDSVVERLKASPGETIADGFSEASVLFADITGFVSMARGLGPERTVALLNRLVSAFDELAERHGVEKIKTIGDAYMVASGVPIPRQDHAQSLAAMALDLIAAVERASAAENIPLNVRVGMASGPMMAGIIGKNNSAMMSGAIRSILRAALNNRASPASSRFARLVTRPCAKPSFWCPAA